MKIYYLSTCDTCNRIMKELDIKSHPFKWQDIKKEAVTEKQVEEMAKLVQKNYPDLKPYESLFSKVALKYRSLGLNSMDLSESDFKRYIQQEYTFLKRPVVLIGDRIFIGNAPKTVAAIAEALQDI